MKIVLTEKEIYEATWDYLRKLNIKVATIRLCLDGKPIKKPQKDPLKSRVTFEGS